MGSFGLRPIIRTAYEGICHFAAQAFLVHTRHYLSAFFIYFLYLFNLSNIFNLISRYNNKSHIP